MSIDRVDVQVPAQRIQSGPSGDAQRSGTGRFGERRVTTGAGLPGDGLSVRAGRTRSSRRPRGTGLLSRVVERAARSAAGFLPGMTRRGRTLDISWPEGRRVGPVGIPADASGAGGGGSVDEGGYEDMRLYQNVGVHPDRPGVDAAGAGGDGSVDEGGYEDMRLYQNVGVHPDRPGVDAAGAGGDSEPVYAEPGPVYEEVGGPVPRDVPFPLHAGVGDTGSEPVYAEPGPVYEAVRGRAPRDVPNPLYAGAGAAGSDPVYAELDSVYEAVGGSDPQDVATHANPAYAAVGGSHEDAYAAVQGLLDASASLFGHETPPEVVEALQPHYENIRDCAAAVNRTGDADEPDYEDISIAGESLIEAMRPLMEAGQIDTGVYENIRACRNRLDPGYAEVGDPIRGTGR